MSFFRITLCLLASLCLRGEAAEIVSVAQMTAGPAAKALPHEAGWGYWTAAPGAWLQTHEGFVARSRKGGVDLVFLGDSITQGWRAAIEENWTGAEPRLRAVNYGIGGDSTRQVIWRIEHGTLDGIRPRLVVLMIGTNNLYRDHNAGSNDEIAIGVKKILALIAEKTPGTRVLLLGVLPRQTRTWCERISDLNTSISRNEVTGRIRFLDAGPAFLDAAGNVKADLYHADAVHLNARGYEVLSSLVKPVVRELLR
jgi:lysophospholipase L1-like esterase